MNNVEAKHTVNKEYNTIGPVPQKYLVLIDAPMYVWSFGKAAMELARVESGGESKQFAGNRIYGVPAYGAFIELYKENNNNTYSPSSYFIPSVCTVKQ